ncbi:MAG: MerR family transcriptional regulator [Bacteroidetes bacterium]|nr:MerR family transcriptional regulator [Bacteroidota bacterium]
MNHFTIKDIETISGIKAQTLRVWEQRYGILVAKRKESKHRIYNNQDLQQILSVAYLNKKGHKISRIAAMTADEIKNKVLEKEQQEHLYENFISQFFEACADINETRFNKIYQALYKHLSFENIMMHVFYPLLERFGNHWMLNQVIPAQEHFACECITRKIELEIQKYPSLNKGPVTLLLLPEGEFHRLPLQYIYLLLKKNGKRAVLLGSNVSIATIKNYLTKNKVEYIQLHLITAFFESTPQSLVEELLNTFTTQKIIVSGPVVKSIHKEDPRLIKLNSVEQLIQFCTSVK